MKKINGRREDYPTQHLISSSKRSALIDASALENDQYVNPSMSSCVNGQQAPKQCEYIQRLLKCLHFHQQLEDISRYDALLAYVTDAKNGNLLDDWYHVLIAHFGDRQTSKESQEQFELVYEELMRFKSLKDCKLETCAAFKRNSRDRQKVLFEDDSELSFYVDLVDDIHCHLLHSFECGFRLRASDLLPLQEEEMNDDGDNDEQGNELNHDKLLKSPNLSRVLSLTRVARNRLESFRGTNTMEHNKFVTEVGTHESAEVDEEKSAAVYSFGLGFRYRDKDAHHSKYYVAPKYKDLQEEVTNNEICRLALFDFKKNVVDNAIKRAASEHAKSIAPCDKKSSQNTGQHGQLISLEHLMAVILYCTFSQLSYEFSRTFRTIKKSETKAEVAGRNREYARWSKLLREAVWCFGDRIGVSNISSYFHGINGEMVFTSFMCEFIGPTSLTAQHHVAATFATSNGIVLELQQDQPELKYFNCAWLSCYSNEDERLLIGYSYGTHKIKLSTIQSMQTEYDYHKFVHAFTWLNNCLQEREPPGYNFKIATKMDAKIIKSMFEHFDDGIEYQNKFHGANYINSLFEEFRENVKGITIDVQCVTKYYGSFYRLLFADENGLVVRFAAMCKMFKNCEAIFVKYDWKNKPDLNVFWKELLLELGKAVKHFKSDNNKGTVIRLFHVKSDEKVLNEMRKADFVRNLGNNKYHGNIWMTIVPPNKKK